MTPLSALAKRVNRKLKKEASFAKGSTVLRSVSPPSNVNIDDKSSLCQQEQGNCEVAQQQTDIDNAISRASGGTVTFQESSQETTQVPGKQCMTPACPHPITLRNTLHLCIGAPLSKPHYQCRLCLSQSMNRLSKYPYGKGVCYKYDYAASKCPICRDTEGCYVDAERKRRREDDGVEGQGSGKRVSRSEDVEGEEEEEDPEEKENVEENPQRTQKARTRPNAREYAANHPWWRNGGRFNRGGLAAPEANALTEITWNHPFEDSWYDVEEGFDDVEDVDDEEAV